MFRMHQGNWFWDLIIHVAIIILFNDSACIYRYRKVFFLQTVYCAKRYVHREWLNPNFPLVRSSVPKIIDFCREDMRAARVFASFDKTQQRFLATSKVDPHLTRLATGKRTFSDPISDPVLAIFFIKVNKNVTGTYYRVSRLWVSPKWLFEDVTWVRRGLCRLVGRWHSRRG